MDFKDVTKDLTSLTDDRIKHRMDEMFRVNPRFNNLDSKNKELIFGLIKKYKDKIRSGIKPSALTIHKDTYNLYENRVKLNLTHNDLDQIRDVLGGFKG